MTQYEAAKAHHTKLSVALSFFIENDARVQFLTMEDDGGGLYVTARVLSRPQEVWAFSHVPEWESDHDETPQLTAWVSEGGEFAEEPFISVDFDSLATSFDELMDSIHKL